MVCIEALRSWLALLPRHCRQGSYLINQLSWASPFDILGALQQRSFVSWIVVGVPPRLSVLGEALLRFLNPWKSLYRHVLHFASIMYFCLLLYIIKSTCAIFMSVEQHWIQVLESICIGIFWLKFSMPLCSKGTDAPIRLSNWYCGAACHYYLSAPLMSIEDSGLLQRTLHTIIAMSAVLLIADVFGCYLRRWFPNWASWTVYLQSRYIWGS